MDELVMGTLMVGVGRQVDSKSGVRSVGKRIKSRLKVVKKLVPYPHLLLMSGGERSASLLLRPIEVKSLGEKVIVDFEKSSAGKGKSRFNEQKAIP
ncbi:unnamed protein product, partial [Protopolystoma xenopodis]